MKNFYVYAGGLKLLQFISFIYYLPILNFRVEYTLLEYFLQEIFFYIKLLRIQDLSITL